MSHFRSILAATGALFFSVCPAAPSQPASGSATAKLPAAGLAKYLKHSDYFEDPLTLNKTGLLDLKVDVNGTPMVLVLDTGACDICLDRASVKQAKLEVKENQDKAHAIGGNISTGQTQVKAFSVGRLTLGVDATVIDFSWVNAMRKQRGDPPCDGLLGGTWFLKHYEAVVDYPHQKLYLRDVVSPEKPLTKLLKKSGYVGVDLEASKDGLLEVKAEVDGAAMLLFLDTGFFDSIISLNRPSAERAKLTIQESKKKLAQLGGTMAIGRAKIGRLSVGGLAAPAESCVLDLGGTNSARQEIGIPLTDGLLGGYFFKKYAAIIDYGGLKLYLLDPAESKPPN